MFKAIQNFDGTDTEKCITLLVGDSLTAVHAVDSVWYIGHNERSGETGAFPVACVDALSENEYTSLPEHIEETANCDRTDDSTNNPRSTLSGGAIAFDPSRIKSKKLKKADPQTANDQRSTEQHDPVEADISESKQSVRADGTLQRVRFENVKLEHSLSVSESVLSWDDSFEQSVNRSVDSHKHYDNIPEHGRASPQRDEGIYHTLDEEKSSSFRLHKDALLHSDRGENRRIKAIFGALFGLIIGVLLYVVLVFSFSYKPLHAGIIVAVSTLIFCICLALSSLCRCIMALVLPNFFTGKGRAVFLSAIFGLMLAGPIANITDNAKESGNSMGCVIDLVGSQARILQRQMAEPVAQMGDYVAAQKQELDNIIDGMSVTLKNVRSTLDNIDKTMGSASTALNDVYEKCRQPITSVVNECKSFCEKSPILSGECLSTCSYLNDAGKVCDPLKTGENYVTTAAQKTRSSLNEALKYFKGDVTVTGDIGGGSNSSKSTKSVQTEIKGDIESKSEFFDVLSYILKKLLSFSILLLFLQSFWYLRNYLAKDGYDNVYITKQFRDLDSVKSLNGQASVLPVKTQERGDYVDTSSWKVNSFELKYCRLGIAQVFLHFLLCTLVIIFDYALFYILDLVRRYGSLDLSVQGQSSFKVAVTGDGPIAQFYKIMLKGLDIENGFSSNLTISRCLPNASQPATWTIPVLLTMYLLALMICLLRGYGMRLRRKIAAYYYPEQERARLEFLHKTIRHRRAGALRFLRQQVKSSNKEKVVKNQLRISTWAVSKCPCFEKCLPSREKLECTSCEQSATGFHKIILTRCGGMKEGEACTAMYCYDCKSALDNRCPLCSPDDVTLRY